MKKNYKMLLVLIVLSTQLFAQRNGKMLFTARLNGANEVPANTAIGKGLITAVVVGNEVTINAVFDSLTGPVTACHFHKGSRTTTGSSITNYVTSVRGNRLYLKTTLTNAQISDMMEDSIYFNVHTAANTGGEIRGQMVFETDNLFDVFASGAQEVPAVATTATAVGSVVLSRILTTGSNKLDYKVVANNLSGAITSAHLHYGDFSVSGRVAYPLSFSGNTLSGTLTGLSLAFVDSLFRGQIYLNIHTAANPTGEIRAELTFIGNGIGFDGILDGAQEVPTNASTAKGAMYANIRSTLDTMDYGVQVNGFAPTAAHFHKGVIGTGGGVVVALTPVGAASLNLYSGKVPLTPALIDALIKDSLYANIHSAAFPNGEIRGQVASLMRTGLVSNLCGGQETPAVNTTASGAGYMSMARDRSDVLLDVVTNGLSTNASGAHIHRAPKGVAGPIIFNLNSLLVGNTVRGFATLTPTAPVTDSIATGLTYFNFHTTANPNGEIRGQASADLVQECLANSTFELNGEKFAVKMAPNPTSERVNLTFDSNEQLAAQIVVSDLTGRQISAQNVQILRGPNNLEVNVSNLNSGIYFIQMRQANRLLFTEKVVKN
jgi:CHRD domain/Secretion system C-terminal sorting domain